MDFTAKAGAILVFLLATLAGCYLNWWTSSRLVGKTIGGNFTLLVGILSARDHFDQRRTIRNTWLSALHSHNNSILHRFIVGDHGCSIPVADRIDQYSCEPWTLASYDEILVLPDTMPAAICEDGPREDDGEEEEEEEVEKNKEGRSEALSFRVQHTIAVHHLGILDSAATPGTIIKLIDAVSQHVVVSTELRPGKMGYIKGGYRYRPVEPYVLPKARQNKPLIGEELVKPINKHIHQRGS